MIVGGTVTTGENSVFETDAPRENRDFIHSKTQHEAGAAKFDFPQESRYSPFYLLWTQLRCSPVFKGMSTDGI